MSDVPSVELPPRKVLIDGGMGRELRMRGVTILNTIWSANGLLVAPETVRAIHDDFIAAGADVITTNTYGVIRAELAREGIEDRFAELNIIACKIAQAARAAGGRPVIVAGSLPPLRGSYRSDLVGPYDEIEPLYREQAEIMMPHVDLFICETMSSAAEGLAAATAACSTGRPVWVSWTLHEDATGRLRSGETIAEAAKAIAQLPVSGYMLTAARPRASPRAWPRSSPWATRPAATPTPSPRCPRTGSSTARRKATA